MWKDVLTTQQETIRKKTSSVKEKKKPLSFLPSSLCNNARPSDEKDKLTNSRNQQNVNEEVFVAEH